MMGNATPTAIPGSMTVTPRHSKPVSKHFNLSLSIYICIYIPLALFLSLSLSLFLLLFLPLSLSLYPSLYLLLSLSPTLLTLTLSLPYLFSRLPSVRRIKAKSPSGDRLPNLRKTKTDRWVRSVCAVLWYLIISICLITHSSPFILSHFISLPPFFLFRFLLHLHYLLLLVCIPQSFYFLPQRLLRCFLSFSAVLFLHITYSSPLLLV